MVDRIPILVIDNQDSFTFNLVHYLEGVGGRTIVERCDRTTAAAALADLPAGVVISPGPGRPEEAGCTPEVVAACIAQRIPILGVCLGHQAIAQHFGAAVVEGHMMHGKTSAVDHDGSGLFAGLPSPMTVTRYHSLVVAGCPNELSVNAMTADGAIMGLRHPTLPIHGVQFHPESIATDHGLDLVANFVALCRDNREHD